MNPFNSMNDDDEVAYKN